MSGDWRQGYKRKFITSEEAMKAVKSGDRVAFTYGREPLALSLALAARKDELKGVRVFARTPSKDFGWYGSGWDENFLISIGYVLPVVRKAMAEGRVDFVPGTLLGVTTDYDVIANVDVLLIELSPPDSNGFCSFGASVWGKKKAVRCARKVIGEVNENLIRTYGDNFIHVSEIDNFVQHVSSRGKPGQSDLLGRKAEEPGEVEKSIVEHVDTLIKDGDCLQIGVGSTSELVVRCGVLANRVDLGWHSETTPQGAIKLARDGVITGKNKNINKGKFVAVAVGGGTREDMDFVNNNPMFELYDADYVLSPQVISANKNVVSINSAIAVDLIGQIAAESIGPVMVSGSGGQLAFAIGGQLSDGGRFITTLPSTARGGAISRIVSQLQKGTIVTVPRTLADIVITEYGIARLRGKSHRERAFELISIAHPKFRAELKQEAKKLYGS